MKGIKRRAAVTAVITAASMLLSTGVSMADSVVEDGMPTYYQPFYLKEDGVYRYLADGSGVEKVADLFQGGEEDDFYESYVAEMTMMMTRQSADGRYLFYMKDYHEDAGGGTLCRRDLGNGGAEQILGTGIYGYLLLGNHSLLYIKAEDEESQDAHLYHLDDGSDRVISLKGVTDVYYTPDGTRLLWDAEDDGYETKTKSSADAGPGAGSAGGYFNQYETNRSLYMVDVSQPDAGPVSLAEGIHSMEVSGDLQTIYYLSDSNLYCLKGLKDKTLVASDVDDFCVSETTGHVYYLTNNKSISLEDLIIDDMQEEDAVMLLPDKSRYETAVTLADGTLTSTLDQEGYRTALDHYYAKLQRDELREYLKSSYYSSASEREWGDLCFYDGTSSEKIAGNVNLVTQYNTPGNALVMCQSQPANLSPVKLSQVSDVTSVLEQIEAGMRAKNSTYSLVADGSVISVPNSREVLGPDATFRLDGVHEQLYYLDDWSSDEGILYAASYAGGVLGEARVVDTGVDDLLIDTGERTIYGKLQSEGASLFTERALIDERVEDALWIDDALYYYKDYDEESGMAKLYRWKESQIQAVADNVWEFEPLPGGAVIVLANYQEGAESGDLYMWRGEAGLVKLDSGVKPLMRSYRWEDMWDYAEEEY